jgi:hypothetical protein
VVALCERRQMEECFAYVNTKNKNMSWFFHLVKLEDVGRSVTWDCKNIITTCSIHSITLVSHRDVIRLKLKVLAYFCFKCMDNNPKKKDNKLHVQPWKLHTLEPINVTKVKSLPFINYFGYHVFLFYFGTICCITMCQIVNLALFEFWLWSLCRFKHHAGHGGVHSWI